MIDNYDNGNPETARHLINKKVNTSRTYWNNERNAACASSMRRPNIKNFPLLI